LYKLAFIQAILLFAIYGIYNLALLYYTFRILKLFQIILFIFILTDVHIKDESSENSKHTNSSYLMYCIGGLVILWILLIIFSKFSNECGQSLYMTYDFILLGTTAYMAFLGYRSLNEIIQTEYTDCQQNIDPNALQVHLDELRERKYSYFI